MRVALDLLVVIVIVAAIVFLAATMLGHAATEPEPASCWSGRSVLLITASFTWAAGALGFLGAALFAATRSDRDGSLGFGEASGGQGGQINGNRFVASDSHPARHIRLAVARGRVSGSASSASSRNINIARLSGEEPPIWVGFMPCSLRTKTMPSRSHHTPERPREGWETGCSGKRGMTFVIRFPALDI
jgi:hypothetical protein